MKNQNVFNLLNELKKRKAQNENPILAGRIMKIGKMFSFLLMLTFVITELSFTANGLPFYDKLELGLKIIKVIGSVVAMASLVAMIYFANDGQRDAVKKAVWFIMAGIVTANIQWFADEFGLMAGAMF